MNSRDDYEERYQGSEPGPPQNDHHNDHHNAHNPQQVKNYRDRSSSRDSRESKKSQSSFSSNIPENSPVRKSRSRSRSPSRHQDDTLVQRRGRNSSKSRDKSRSRGRSESRGRNRSRSRDKDIRRSRSRNRERSTSKDMSQRRTRRSTSPSRTRAKSNSRERSTDRSRGRSRSRSRSKNRSSKAKSRSRSRENNESKNIVIKQRTRDYSRDRSRSRSRSKDRPKRRQKAYHNAFNVEQVIATINAARIGEHVGLPSEYLAKVGENLTYIQSTRACRRLFIGNLPSHLDLNEFVIAEYFRAFMKKYNFKTPEPILTVSLSETLTFAFVEFRSVEDATALGYMMNGITMGGRKVRVARPKDFAPPSYDLQQFIVGYTPGQFRPPPVKCLGEIDLLAEVPATNFIGDVDLTQKSVIVFHSLLVAEELISDESWLDIVDDLREECSVCLLDPPPSANTLLDDPPISGRIRRIVVPRPQPPQGVSTEINKETGNYVPVEQRSSTMTFIAYGPWKNQSEVGKAYVLFADEFTANKVYEQLQNRLYHNTIIKVQLITLGKYTELYEY